MKVDAASSTLGYWSELNSSVSFSAIGEQVDTDYEVLAY